MICDGKSIYERVESGVWSVKCEMNMRLKQLIPLAAACCAMAALVFCPAEAAECAHDGLQLCAEMLIPSLLPFFVVSGLLRAWGLPGILGRLLEAPAAWLWGVDGACVSAFLLGALGGYPLGAATISQLRADGAISREEGERALAFCSNTGPAFLVGAAGTGVFHSRSAGLLLYGAHVLAAVLVGMLVSKRSGIETPRERSYIAAASVSKALPEAVEQAAGAMLSVSAFVVLFSAAAGLLEHIGYLPALAGRLSADTGMELTAARSLLTGLLEIGSGLGAMRGLAPTVGNLALCAFLLSFGGLAVWCQTLGVIAESDLTGRYYLPGKLLQGVTAAILVLLAGH